MSDLLSHHEPVPESTVDLLLACHARIRRFTRGALALLEAEVPAIVVAATARALVDYFGRALRLHSQDEDLSLRPRLEAGGHLSWETAAIAAQHERIHALVDQLLVRWEVIAREPDRLGDERAGLLAPTVELGELFEAHLSLEEERVFPHVRELLTEEMDREIVREMRERRAPRGVG